MYLRPKVIGKGGIGLGHSVTRTWLPCDSIICLCKLEKISAASFRSFIHLQVHIV
jgi:hypothetical protein